MKRTILGVFLTFALVGCGGGGGGSSDAPLDQDDAPSTGEIEMVKDHVYIVYPGDQILKTSSPSQVWIQHVDGHSESKVKLIEGSAKIVRGSR